VADNSNKYINTPFAVKTGLTSPDKEQTAIVYDLLTEGPIEGLVNGKASVYYNDVPLVESGNLNIIKSRKFTVNTTAADAEVVSTEFGVIRQLTYNNKTGLSIGERSCVIAGAGTKGTGLASMTAGSRVVTTSSNYFTQAMVDAQGSPLPVYIRIKGAAAGGQTLVTRLEKINSATEAVVTTRALTTVSAKDIAVDHFSKISSISGNTATLTTAPVTTTTNAVCLVSAPKLPESEELANFSNVQFGITKGEMIQPPLIAYGFTGSSSTVYDANIQIRQADLANVSGLSSLGTSYNATNIDEPGNVNQGSASDTVLTASAMGVSNPSEIDEIHLTFSFPEMHAFKSSGAKGPSFVEFQIFFEYTVDGSNYTSALAFGPGNSTILSRSPDWGNKVTYGIDGSGSPTNGYIKPSKGQYSEFIEEFVMNVEEFQPFSNYRVRIRRLTDEDFKDGSFQHKNASYLKTVENVVKDRLSYPYAAYASNVFNAKDFSGGLPSRAYKLKGKLIQVPTNYLTRDESSDGKAKYTRAVSGGSPSYAVSEEATYQTWDGSFRGDKTSWAEGHPNREPVYCNNPAWVFYDILTNNRYGLGQFVDKNLIDKYSLFEIAKYCDELVPNGEGGEEPRFTCNLYLSKTAEATKVLRDIASVFRGMVLWMDGEIVAIADRPKEPVYTFSKGNVENGVFTYEGTGDRVRTNQVKVTWNDPNDNYRQAVEYVEDHQNIAKTNRIVREASIAFGCTSRAQAHRYGKWKLLSAQLEKETVTFTTGLNVAGLRPGDIIAVQDADKDGLSYSGRISNTGTKSTTVVPLDRTITLPAYSSDYPHQLLLIYPEGGCYLQQETATINGTTYFQGDLLLETDAGAVLDTQEEAANLKDDNGNSVLNYWSENVRVEKKSITTTAGSVSSLTVSSAFSSTPTSETIWAIQLINTDGTPRLGTAKEYKIVSIKEDKDQKFQIVASEFARAKFDAVERGFTIYSKPTEPIPDNDEAVPSPRTVVAKIEAESSESPDGQPDDSVPKDFSVRVSWSHPLNDDNTKYKYVSSYEIKHTFEGDEFETITVKGNRLQKVFRNIPFGTYQIHIRTISSIGTKSPWVVRKVTISSDEVPTTPSTRKLEIPTGGQFNQSLAIDTSSGLAQVGSATYTFIAANGREFTLSSTGTGNYQQSFSGMGASATAYLLFDANASSDYLKAIQVHTDSNVTPAIEYWKEVGASNNGVTQATGTISISQFSNQLDGSSTTFTSDFASGDLVKLDNGTAAEAFYARVQAIESDTLMFLDGIVPRAYSSDDIYKQSFKPNINKDTILATVVTDGSTNYSFSIVYAITAGIVGQDGSDGTDARAVNLTIEDQTFEYDTNGANPSPAGPVDLTATALNTTNTVFYEFYKNDVSVQHSTDSVYDYTPPSAYSDMPEKLEVQITESATGDIADIGSVLARDQLTVTGLRAGSDAVTIILSNEAHTLSTTNTGTVTYTGSGTDIEVYIGTTQATYDNTSAYGNNTFRFGTITGSGISPSSTSASDGDTTVTFPAHSNMTADVASITYPIIVKDSAGVENTFTKIQSFAKSFEGGDGANGTKTAIVYAYQRSSSTLTSNPGGVTVTLEGTNAGKITTPSGNSLSNGWTKEIPSGTNPLYVCAATAAGTGSTDSIAASEWSSPVILSQDGDDGLNSAVVRIYKRRTSSTSAGNLPSGNSTYTFSSGALSFSTANGWSASVPTSGGSYLWTSQATAASTSSTDTIPDSEWAAASILAQDGTNGEDGDDGLRTATGNLYYQSESASAPSAPSNSGVTFTFSTGAMSGGVIGTGSSNWNVFPPTATGGSGSSKTWFVTYNVTESSAGSGTGTPSFDSTVRAATSFTGLVTFSSGDFVQNGSTITTIDGGNISAGSTITVGTASQVQLQGNNNRILITDSS